MVKRAQNSPRELLHGGFQSHPAIWAQPLIEQPTVPGGGYRWSIAHVWRG